MTLQTDGQLDGGGVGGWGGSQYPHFFFESAGIITLALSLNNPPY